MGGGGLTRGYFLDMDDTVHSIEIWGNLNSFIERFLLVEAKCEIIVEDKALSYCENVLRYLRRHNLVFSNFYH